MSSPHDMKTKSSFDAVEKIADDYFAGQFVVLKHGSNWKVGFGSKSFNSQAISDLPIGISLFDAAIKSVSALGIDDFGPVII